MSGPVRPRGSRLACPWPLLAGLLVNVLGFATGRPATASPAEQAQALVERAAAHIGPIGSAQAFADISRPGGDFVDGELYVFCHSAPGHVLANGGNPQLVGRNLLTLRDAAGRLPIVEINRVGLGEGRGWVEYLWPNPQTQRVQRKISVHSSDRRPDGLRQRLLPSGPAMTTAAWRDCWTRLRASPTAADERDGRTEETNNRLPAAVGFGLPSATFRSL